MCEFSLDFFRQNSVHLGIKLYNVVNNFMKYPFINTYSDSCMICYEMLLVPKVFDVQLKKMQMQFQI